MDAKLNNCVFKWLCFHELSVQNREQFTEYFFMTASNFTEFVLIWKYEIIQPFCNNPALQREQLWNNNIISCICFKIHRSVQAPFQGAGVVESTIMSQHLLKSYDLYLLNIRQRQVLSTIIFNMRIKITLQSVFINSFLLFGYDRGMYKLYNVHVRSKDLKQNSTH